MAEHHDMQQLQMLYYWWLLHSRNFTVSVFSLKIVS